MRCQASLRGFCCFCFPTIQGSAARSGIRMDLFGNLSRQSILDLLRPTLCVAGSQSTDRDEGLSPTPSLSCHSTRAPGTPTSTQSLSIRDRHLSLIPLALFQCSILMCSSGGEEARLVRFLAHKPQGKSVKLARGKGRHYPWSTMTEISSVRKSFSSGASLSCSESIRSLIPSQKQNRCSSVARTSTWITTPDLSSYS